jgi:hypothetical protein
VYASIAPRPPTLILLPHRAINREPLLAPLKPAAAGKVGVGV